MFTGIDLLLLAPAGLALHQFGKFGRRVLCAQAISAWQHCGKCKGAEARRDAVRDPQNAASLLPRAP
ncbi:hypothetical protein [Cereibacter sphaeroides]|uniref:hypothetical protein n=1 Tax=Cereibacter sphaeroides TaxID=1063 RepID=UPI001F1DFA59|nr:hypothetical protein [Cereibacter sphaeroides]MCE6970407.1 hypothetical protein [Cereibacter sphaeroides]